MENFNIGNSKAEHIAANFTEDIEKAERKQLTGGSWKTINGAKVYVKGGKVVAGAEGKLSGEGGSKSGSSKSSGRESFKSKISQKEKEYANIGKEMAIAARDARDAERNGGSYGDFMDKNYYPKKKKSDELKREINKLHDDYKKYRESNPTESEVKEKAGSQAKAEAEEKRAIKEQQVTSSTYERSQRRLERDIASRQSGKSPNSKVPETSTKESKFNRRGNLNDASADKKRSVKQKKVSYGGADGMAKIGDKISMRTKRSGGLTSGVDGEVYEISSSGKTFRLKDEFGNKDTKWRNVDDYKSAKVKRIDNTPTLDTFKEVAKESKTVDEFISKVRKIKGVPQSVANEFSSKYGNGSDIKGAAAKFMEAHGGSKSISKSQTMEDNIEKGKKVPVGTVSRGYKKMAEGKWVPVKDEKKKEVPLGSSEKKMNARKEVKESNKLTDAEKTYFKENKKEIMAIIEDDPLASVKQAINDHKNKNKKESPKKESSTGRGEEYHNSKEYQEKRKKFFNPTVEKINRVSGKELKDLRTVIDKNYGKWSDKDRKELLSKIDSK
jgi:hypothetical protein